MNPEWTDQEDALLKKLWREGKSASEIAKELPRRTRNGVIGRVHRIGAGRAKPILPARAIDAPTPVRKPRAPKVKAAPKPTPPKPGQQGKVAVVLGTTFPPCSPQEADKKRAASAEQGRSVIKGMDAVANDNAIPLLERRFGQCAWPVGTPARPADQMVCGAKVFEGIEPCTYCLTHAKRAYVRDVTQPRPKENLTRSLRRWAA